MCRVRKHRAPNGALRRECIPDCHRFAFSSQKAPSAKRCIKTLQCDALQSCTILGQKAPSAKRCIKTSSQRLPGNHHRLVRKHRAPNGALRQCDVYQSCIILMSCQKAPSAKRCIKTLRMREHTQLPIHRGQKAPSTKRCIKTPILEGWGVGIKTGQKAPSAKRCIKTHDPHLGGLGSERQKAPSAKRCIKTHTLTSTSVFCVPVRKHRAPKGALRLVGVTNGNGVIYVSESTERQKVH